MVNLINQFGHDQEIKVDSLVYKIYIYIVFILTLGNQWLKGQYGIFPPANTKYQIVFEGIVGQ
jgi:hypothetical protein